MTYAERIAPTDEDLAIFERIIFHRLLAFKGQRMSIALHLRIETMLVNMTNDYIELPPPEPHDGEIDF